MRYWFAIDIAIRYRSCPAFSIASSDSDPERTMITRCGYFSFLPQVENAPQVTR
ncbi:MAG: hypothetical protein BECKG1743D_GA0114223_101391 [Candidatus Kentron sp. G]|nr:MAG: hypothetical protein BECKG1743E_GA0114224_101961 [Candidatus Kentron sp. G]VFM99682.1 MAG: hypothetical protein BECKG1743D_GA0114223_101391 [Candidatus Kentron sp. G]